MKSFGKPLDKAHQKRGQVRKGGNFSSSAAESLIFTLPAKPVNRNASLLEQLGTTRRIRNCSNGLFFSEGGFEVNYVRSEVGLETERASASISNMQYDILLSLRYVLQLKEYFVENKFCGSYRVIHRPWVQRNKPEFNPLFLQSRISNRILFSAEVSEDMVML